MYFLSIKSYKWDKYIDLYKIDSMHTIFKIKEDVLFSKFGKNLIIKTKHDWYLLI